VASPDTNSPNYFFFVFLVFFAFFFVFFAMSSSSVEGQSSWQQPIRTKILSGAKQNTLLVVVLYTIELDASSWPASGARRRAARSRPTSGP
jgi:heme/copper-type cytochrome/quinol oxidase subunit 3